MKKPSAGKVDSADTTSDPSRYRLRLYVSGATTRSAQAIANIKQIGEMHLQGRYELEVIDAFQQAELLCDQQIVALPTLVRHLPLPLRRMVGNLSDRDRVMLGLGLVPEAPDIAAVAK